jgi:hypothetical protein
MQWLGQGLLEIGETMQSLRKDNWFAGTGSWSNVVGRFVDVEVTDIKASEAARKTIYKRVPALESKVPGSSDISVSRVKDFNKMDLAARFPGAWEHYELHHAQDASEDDVPVVHAISGTPLHLADFIPKNALPRLKDLGFSTLEQIRDMSDTTAQNIGHGAKAWRKKAGEFLART